MGKQVNFYLTKSDEKLLLEVLAEKLKSVIVISRTDTPEVKEIDIDEYIALRSSNPFVVLSRQVDLEGLVLDELGDSGVYDIDSEENPVVEYSSCHYSDVVFRHARMWFSVDYWDSELQKAVPKDPGFVEWANRLLQKTRKCLIFDKKIDRYYYFGQEAYQMRLEGKIRFE